MDDMDIPDDAVQADGEATVHSNVGAMEVVDSATPLSGQKHTREDDDDDPFCIYCGRESTRSYLGTCTSDDVLVLLPGYIEGRLDFVEPFRSEKSLD